MDKIYIRDLEFIGYHGVFEEEKKLGQKFYLSLELSTNLREANDDITKTTHYGEVAETVKKVFFQKKYDLIETLAEDIAREVLLSFPLIKEVKLEIKKTLGTRLDCHLKMLLLRLQENGMKYIFH